MSCAVAAVHFNDKQQWQARITLSLLCSKDLERGCSALSEPACLAVADKICMSPSSTACKKGTHLLQALYGQFEVTAWQDLIL